MYLILLSIHSILRWLLLVSLLYAIYRAFKGLRARSLFSALDNSLRHWTATIAHVQLIVGIILYTQSPIIKYFWHDFTLTSHVSDALFFGLLHLVCMIAAIIVLTIGSALSKRRLTDREKFKTMFAWFTLALLLLFLAIPWPFSPLAHRPYLRSF